MHSAKIASRMLLVACFVHAGIASGTASDPITNDAKKLVQNALKAELAGLPNERTELLKRALQADSSYAPARWHSGQVLMGNGTTEQNWLSIEEAENKAASDTLLAEYAKMRSAKSDDAEGNTILANWCQRRGLKVRARLHWARVLRFQPNNKTAIRRLNLKGYQGRWYTQDQIAEIKKYRIRTAQLQRKWRPKIASWRRAYLGKDRAAREDARLAMKEAANAELVGLFETQLSPHNQSLALAVVDAVAGVKEQTATESLVRHAALSKWSSVRSAATKSLKGRSPHGYVPILIDAMLAPYEFQSWTVRSPLDDDNVLALNYAVGQKKKHADHLMGGSVNFIGARTSDQAEEIEEEIRDQIAKLNDATERFNQPIWQALQETTGQNLPNDPSQWNEWWNDYNEYQVPDFRPVFASFQRPRSVVVANQPFSCFPAGTLVSTQTGRKPIEKIEVGDYVLSQDAVTGELAYKPVVETTIRQSDAIMNVTLDEETLLVTRGHPMWVNGRQWQMAKQLRRGDFLHGVNGPVKVDEVRHAGKDTKVYNLVVSDFHTYFVGEARVLVHDNSLYTPPGVAVPGE